MIEMSIRQEEIIILNFHKLENKTSKLMKKKKTTLEHQGKWTNLWSFFNN